MTEDNRLLFLIQNMGSESAKDKLIRKYYDRIYAYAYRRTHRVEDSLDITQEIFIKVIRALPAYDKKKANFQTWIYAIASNCIYDHCKKSVTFEELREELPDEKRFEKVVENRELAGQIMNFLKQQDESLYQVVDLKIFAELTFDEIGYILKQSPNTVKTKYYSAIRKCRKEFEADADRIPFP